MPRDESRYVKDENGREVYQVPKGTPKEELEAEKRKREEENTDTYKTKEDRDESRENKPQDMEEDREDDVRVTGGEKKMTPDNNTALTGDLKKQANKTTQKNKKPTE